MLTQKIVRQLKKLQFPVTICNLEKNQWSEWTIVKGKQIKVKWDWHNKDDLIIKIYKKLSLISVNNPGVNYVYYKYLHNPNEIEQNCYNFALQEIKITNLSPEKRRKLISEATKETGIDPKKNEKIIENYALRKTLPNLLLLNDLGVELTQDDFYKVKDISIISDVEQVEGVQYFGIIPETLVKANKYYAPYTYFFDSINKKYLLEAVRIVNSISEDLTDKKNKNKSSFREKLFLINDLISDIDKAYQYNKPNADKTDKKHTIKRLFHQSAEKLFISGMNMIVTKQYNAGIDYFRQAIRIDCFFYPAWYKMGVAYFNLRDWNSALKSVNKSIDINPFFADSFFYRGLIFTALHKFKDAYNDLNQAIYLDNNNSDFYSTLAMICTFMLHYDEAKDNLNTAITISKSSKHFLQRAKIYYTLEQYNECISDCKDAICLDNEKEEALGLIIKAVEKLADDSKLQEVCILILRQNPCNYWANYNLIKSKIEAREYEEAFLLLKKVEKFYQNNMDFLKLKVVTQLRSGKKYKKTFRQIRKLQHANNNYEPFNLRNHNYRNTKMYANYRCSLWEWTTFFENDAYV